MKTLSENLRTVSIVLLAASIFYFSYALLHTIETARVISERAGAVTQSLTPVVDLAPQFLDEADKLRQTTEGVVAEVTAVRETLPSVLAEVKATRETVPSILAETERLRLESQAIRKEVALTRAQIPAILEQLDAYQKLAPQVLAESARIRQSIPPTLDRIEALMAQADEVASSAGENVFTGMLAGIVKAPFKLIGHATSAIMPSGATISDTDKATLEQRIQAFLGTAKVGDTESYVSADGSLTWRYQLQSTSSRGNAVCRVLGLTTLEDRKKVKTTELTICLDEQGKWLVQEAD